MKLFLSTSLILVSVLLLSACNIGALRPIADEKELEVQSAISAAVKDDSCAEMPKIYVNTQSISTAVVKPSTSTIREGSSKLDTMSSLESSTSTLGSTTNVVNSKLPVSFLFVPLVKERAAAVEQLFAKVPQCDEGFNLTVQNIYLKFIDEEHMALMFESGPASVAYCVMNVSRDSVNKLTFEKRTLLFDATVAYKISIPNAQADMFLIGPAKDPAEAVPISTQQEPLNLLQ